MHMVSCFAPLTASDRDRTANFQAPIPAQIVHFCLVFDRICKNATKTHRFHDEFLHPNRMAYMTLVGNFDTNNESPGE